MFEGSEASNFVQSVDTAFLFTLIVSVFFLVLITTLMIVFVIKYNRKRNRKAENVHSNLALEITWTVIPTILVLIMFWFGWTGYKEISDIPEEGFNVKVTAQMWKWTFEYENGIQKDTLYVPADKTVILTMHSLDVNHAFFVPAFKLKKDVYPGQQRKAWFVAKPGSYNIACAEYCGLNHSYMYSKVIALPEEEFNEWYNRNSEPVGENKKDVIEQ
ncbi:MAG: hypothetical protein Kow0098_17730 [Ignavibacteriaceae bacterium]